MKFVFVLLLALNRAMAAKEVVWNDSAFECRPYAVHRDSNGEASNYDIDVVFERDPKIASMRGCLTVILNKAGRTCTLRHHEAQSINPINKPINIQFTNFYIGENFGFFPEDDSLKPHRAEFDHATKWFRSALEIPQIGQWKAECAAFDKIEHRALPPKCVTEANGPDNHAPCGPETSYSL